MKLFRGKNRQASAAGVCAASVQTAAKYPFSVLDTYNPLSSCEGRIYSALREAVPVIDAAIYKLVRLTGGFTVKCPNPQAQRELDAFMGSVPVGAAQRGIEAFISAYLEQLLVYGTAAGEMVVSRDGRLCGLYNADLECLELRRAENPFNVSLYVKKETCGAVPVKHPEFILLSVLNPEPGRLGGTSLLRGLPFVSSVLLKIYSTIGVNWERLGNIRFAVTYKPQNDVMDKTYARERAQEIAEQWSRAMKNTGTVSDFVAVGDVSIKVIGADNQIMDSEVPVRQMLEQIIAKTGLPPFVLGLNWSSTERMSRQQTDILTSELEAYRRILAPVILKIADTFLALQGYSQRASLEWDDISLQDELELSRARLYTAQAKKIEAEVKEKI